MTRDQQRAVFAYTRAADVPPDKRKDYEIALMALGANILRSGLVAAIADLQRRKERGRLLLDDLGRAGVPGIDAADVAKSIRALPTAKYMLAQREMLLVVTWLKRAVQATFEDKTPQPAQGAATGGATHA